LGSFSDKDLSDFIESVHASSTSSEADPWAGVYNRISSLVSSGQGGLSLHSANDDRFSIIATTIDPDYIRSYFEHYQYISPFRRTIVELKAGEHFSRRAFLSDSEYIKSPYYNEFYKGQEVFEIEHHALFSSGGITGGISLTRPKSHPEFSVDERKLIARGVQHLRVAFKNYVELTSIRVQNDLFMSVLNNEDKAIFVVDSNMRASFCNLKAEEMLRDGKSVKLATDRKLRFSSSTVDKTVGLACSAIEKFDNGSATTLGPLHFNAGNKSESITVELNYIGSVGPSWAPSGRHLMISIPFRKTQPDRILLLASEFGLSRAEQRVARMLVEGLSPIEVSDKLEISINTVRSHMKKIFRKTGSRRQSDLIRLLLS